MKTILLTALLALLTGCVVSDTLTNIAHGPVKGTHDEAWDQPPMVITNAP